MCNTHDIKSGVFLSENEVAKLLVRKIGIQEEDMLPFLALSLNELIGISVLVKLSIVEANLRYALAEVEVAYAQQEA